MGEAWAYVEGRVVPMTKARVPLADRGHLLGDGVFETMRANQGEVLFLERHLARFSRGLAALRIDGALAEAREAVERLLEAGGHGHLALRLQVTTGASEGPVAIAGRFAVTGIVRPLQTYPREHYEEGVRVHLDALKKPVPAGLGGAKSTSLQAHLQARLRAADVGAHDALLLNETGRVCEATTSNVIAFVAGAVKAPGVEEGAVDGVTRAWALDELRREGLRVTTELETRDLLRAEEILLTNTIGGVVPVAEILSSGRRPQGAAGSLYRNLRARHLALTGP